MFRITRTVAAGLIAVTALAALGRVSAAPIQPDSLTGLALWLKADDIVPGVEPANGAAVSTWRDHSGNGYDAVVPTDLPPTFLTPERQQVTVSVLGGTNSFPVVRFNTTDDELLRAADIIDGPDGDSEAAENANFGEVTVIAVYQTASLTADNRPVGFGTSYNDNRGGVNSNNFHLATDPSIRKDNGAVTGYTTLHPTDFLVRSTTMSATGGFVEDFFDGTPVLSSTNNYDIRSDNFYIGDMRWPTGEDFDVAEVIVYNRALDAAERQAVEEYLVQKYLPEVSAMSAISVDFNRGEGITNGGQDMAPIEVAGIEPRRYWNQGRSAAALGTAGNPDVIDSKGNVVAGVEITWNTAGSGATNNANAGGTTANERMMHDYAARNPEGDDLEVIVTGLPPEYTALGYDVILYQDSISSKSGQHTFNLDWGNDGTVDDVLTLADTGASNYVDTGDPAADFAGYYVRFTVPRGIADFKLTVSGTVQMELNGMQIVQNVPEPSALLLSLLGLPALVLCARRRSRRAA